MQLSTVPEHAGYVQANYQRMNSNSVANYKRMNLNLQFMYRCTHEWHKLNVQSVLAKVLAGYVNLTGREVQEHAHFTLLLKEAKPPLWWRDEPLAFMPSHQTSQASSGPPKAPHKLKLDIGS
jgi:hypothetical protein